MPDLIRRNVDPATDVGNHYPLSTSEGMLLGGPSISSLVTPNIPAGINPFITGGTVQKFPLGTTLQYNDRRFRYCLAGATGLAVGKLMQSVVPLAGHIDEVTGGGAAEATTVAFTPNTVTTDNVAANELADGYIYINSGTGQGYSYRIKSHPAIVGGVSGTLTLYDPLVITTSAAAKATVVHNPWRKVILHPSPPTAQPVCVTVCAVTADHYFWGQVGGPCPVLIDGSVVIKNNVVPSGTTDGSVMANIDFQLESVVGQVMVVNATTEYGLIWLTLP